MSRAVHHQTGLHYGVVIPPTWGPFTDIRACYEEVARCVPWLTVVSPGQEIDWQDPDLFVLHWNPERSVPARAKRNATTALVYSEALDPDPARMLPDHRAHFARVVEMIDAGVYDGLFAHTPYMVELLALRLARRSEQRIAVLPVGWEPSVMGRPRGTHRVHDLVYHGSMAGRRKVLLPFLRDRLGPALADASGCYGRGLVGALEAAYASIYIAHSPVASFSTWRLWQALAAGCAMVAEPGDAWPFEAGKHYVPIGPFSLDNAVELADELAAMAKLHAYAPAPGGGDEPRGLLEVAERALTDLGHFTTLHCVMDYLCPASVEMRRAR